MFGKEVKFNQHWTEQTLKYFSRNFTNTNANSTITNKMIFYGFMIDNNSN